MSIFRTLQGIFGKKSLLEEALDFANVKVTQERAE
jgi:hypothetical protein